MKTVFITGCSSGFGLVTAELFLDRGWQVIASMRSLEGSSLEKHERLRALPLDVTDIASIRRAIEVAGPIDVLVNNAGVGLFGALEAASMASVRQIFEINILGTIAMTQAVLPQMRARRSGVIVNVSSMVTEHPLPLLSTYTASKAAVNAFTESLAIELQEVGVRAHLVLPGRAPSTRFGESARSLLQGPAPEAYASLLQKVVGGMTDQADGLTFPSDVADAIWRAATDPGSPMRLPAGADAVAVAARSSGARA
ncbi:SDR family oxidoreductase [Paucibacter sp. M5-1]|uniref:SDR family oxidoreductase n=1 Tax=Paucibacter sp. M5-1 TaxID=3015998 RepID=UPI0022B8701C|nr:SDR family oxidoreductase [Paucibacter sp. M5-1]MCZ7880594.1 SDR family oxidoreductase [Paucibacter sp. M5-1]